MFSKLTLFSQVYGKGFHFRTLDICKPCLNLGIVKAVHYLKVSV